MRKTIRERITKNPVRTRCHLTHDYGILPDQASEIIVDDTDGNGAVTVVDYLVHKIRIAVRTAWRILALRR